MLQYIIGKNVFCINSIRNMPAGHDRYRVHSKFNFLKHVCLTVATVVGIMQLNQEEKENRIELTAICSLLTSSGDILHTVPLKTGTGSSWTSLHGLRNTCCPRCTEMVRRPEPCIV